MSDHEYLVEVNSLGWRAGERDILSEVSFRIREGAFVGLIGPNGAGKSSLMRCMYRVNQPATGSVMVAGKNVWEISAREAARQTAVIVQELGQTLGLRVREFIAQGLTPHKRMFEGDSAADHETLAELIHDFELGNLIDHSFMSLSGGEKQRALLARALMQRPQLLIMDEPTNHLDVHYQIEALKQVKKLDLTVLASFHDLNVAAAFCDELLVLDHGEIVAQGTPEEVLTEDLISRVFRTCCVVDEHPIHKHPRVSYAYHD